MTISPSSYAFLQADDDNDDGDMSTSPPETLTVSTVAAAVVGVGHHLLKVEGYSQLKSMYGDTGSYLKFGEFTAGGHAWRVHCYLNGKHQEDAGFMSLYVALAPAVTSAAAAGVVVHAEVEFELPHHHGTAAARWLPSYGKHGLAVPFKAGGKEWGFRKFIAVKNLERSGLLRDDCFAVRCTVTVVEEQAVVEEDVTVEDMDRVGVVCPCKDESCRFKHERPAETLWEKIALFGRSLCGEASS
ncbi:unnamed protein product [Urochloa humidicola]